MKILINTTTFPNSPESPVPAFVSDQIKAMYALDNNLDIDVLIPHHAYGDSMPNFRDMGTHKEIRYHYFLPRNLEKLAGRGILPALKEKPQRVGLIPFHLIFQYLALRKLCRKNRPDVVYAHWFMSPAIVSYFVCKTLKIPLIFTTHASDVSVLKKIPFSKSLIANVLDYSTAFTAVSQRTKKKLTNFFSAKEWSEKYADKMSVLPMGTSLNEKVRTESDYSSLLQNVGIITPHKYILAMGRLAEKKGFSDLIKAYGKLPSQQQIEYQLVIAGEGQLGPALKKQAKALKHKGSIIFPGYVSGDLKFALLSQCNVFVMPSIIDDKGDSEGLPVTLMEAISKERLVIASNVSGAEEVLIEEAGYLVDQKSPTQLAEVLSRSLGLPLTQKTKMQKAARELSLQFDWRIIAEKHLLILRAAKQP